MQRGICLLLLVSGLLTACSRNANLQGKGQPYLQGEWQQDSSAVQKQLMTYTSFHFKFTCDSFYIRQQTFTRINYGSDTCMNKGKWTEYIRGTYSQKHDTLQLKGDFCNADYSLKITQGCFRFGVYEDVFKVVKKTDSLIQLTGAASEIPINIRLVKRIICNPKPL